MPSRRVTLSKELKTALSELPVKEKDKLLFRLLPTKPDLVAKLEYELLEGGNSKEERRAELGEAIEKKLAEDVVPNFYSPGYLLLDYRFISGRITEHVKTTKDKEGEVELNILMLADSLPALAERIDGFSAGRSRTLSNYVVKRARKILKLLGKFHRDIRLDYASDLERIGRAMGRIDAMMRTAVHEGFDVNWLLSGEWPEDV